ncbi:MAG: ATP-dependent sacrificial sulfur transferase LarE [Candidatus Helarchaeota archaeon]|nr:ATP-dependent sacrificial sulfur transferase LarE [Candidatus Helarchaeota archaeon]
MDKSILKKIDKVHDILKNKKVLIAYSGGVDSSTISSLAKDVSDRVLAVTVNSQLMTNGELKDANDTAKEIGIEWKVIDVDVLSNEKFVENPPDRCYYCKIEILNKILAVAKEESLELIIDGTNADDLEDHRPGHVALLELNVRSPLAEAGLRKNEIREIAKFRGLKVWERPSMACLASRIPYGKEVTAEKLKIIEKAENVIKHKARVKVVRVRCYDDLAKIEIGKNEMNKIYSEEIIKEITEYLKSLGFKYVTLDLEGYRSGALDEVL